MTGRPRVVYWNNQPNPYVVARLNAVVDRGNVAVEAWFETEREPDRSWRVDPATWRFPARFMTQRTVAGRRLPLPAGELAAARPDLLVLGYDQPQLALGALLGRRYAGRVAFRALPTFDAWSERHWWSELAKHGLFRSVDGAKVPGGDGRALCARYGLPAARVHRVTQSIDLDRYTAATAVPAAERARRRLDLELTGCAFVYVGRLWWGKGLDTLLDAYAAVRADLGAAVSLLLVGDGPDADRYRARAAALPGVAFAGFVQAGAIAPLYACADALVFPTLGDPNGLVVEEAMAAGLPVLTSDAAGDIRRRVPEGEVGYVVPAGDAGALGARMRHLALHPAERTRLGRAASGRARSFAVDRYAEDFEAFVAAVLAGSRRRGPCAALASVGGAVLAGLARVGG